MKPICRRLATIKNANIRRERRFPLSGDILVKPGDLVEPETLVGYNSSEECLHFLRLEVYETKPLAKLLRNVGDAVKRGEPVAYYMYFFGLGYKEYVSPVNGTLVSFEPASGTLMIREHPEPVHAGMHGLVEEVIEGHSITLSASGVLVEGTAGWGQLAYGELLVLADSPDEELDPQRLGPHCRGKVVVVGACADSKVINAAYRHGARALIAGSVDRLAGDEFEASTAGMSYEEYAARYYTASLDVDADMRGGLDRVTMTVLATDGLGRTPMRPDAFSVLRANEGRVAYVDGGSGRPVDGMPEVFVSERPQRAVGDTAVSMDVAEGTAVAGGQAAGGTWLGLADGMQARVIGGLRHGVTGRVASWGGQITLETGRVVTGARLRVADGSELEVALTNLELLHTGG